MYAAAPSSVAEAAMQGNRDAVKTLLKDGADVNTAMGDGMTALHYAAARHDVELAKMLLYEFWNEAFDRATQNGDFAHQPRAKVSVLFAGHHEHGLNPGRELAVHPSHLQFVFVVTDSADATENSISIHPRGVIHHQPFEGVH